MALKEKIQDIEVGLIGNRISAVSKAVTLASAIGFGIAIVGSSPALTLAYLAGLYAGGLGLLLTDCGKCTKRIYQQTAEHLEELGELDRYFFRSVMGKAFLEKKVFGYCELQGIYLACRDNGKLEDFYRLKRERTKNIVPNF